MDAPDDKDTRCDRREFLAGKGWLPACLGAIGLASVG
jgi:hypothetical protein